MVRGKIVVLLLTILILVSGAWGCTSQGPQEQKRGTESQETPGEEEITEETMETPQKLMEETADEEQKGAG